jgi:hypothetical protein
MEQNSTAGRVQLHAHVEPEIRDQLVEVARTNDRSLAAEIRRALAEHLRERKEQNA